MNSVNICFKSLQGKESLLQNQNNRLKSLTDWVKSRGGISQLLSNIDLLTAVVGDEIVSQDRTYATKLHPL